MQNIFDLRNDPQYLSTEQYQDSANLSSRIQVHQKFSTATQNWFDFVLELAAIKPDYHVLELGCGHGMLWRNNLNRIPESSWMTLTDLSLGMVNEAQRSLQKGHRFSFVCMDSMDLAFPPETFDLVIANHMLYHVPSIPHVLAEVEKVLKPGGRFMAATNGDHYMNDLDVLLERFSQKLEKPHSMSKNFNLLNGEMQLRPFFKDIELHLYSGDLFITNAQMLTNYAYSTPLVKETMGQEGKTEMTAFFQRRIDHYGGISIRKETGVFLAKKALSTQH